MARNKKMKRRRKVAPPQPVKHHLPPSRHPQVGAAIESSNSLIAQGKYDDALDLCEQILEIEPRNAQIFLTKATAYEQAGNTELAEQAYITAFKLFPNFLPAMVNYGLMFYRAGQLEKSIKAFNAVLALGPDFIPALDGASRSLIDLRRYQLAVPVLERLARLRGTSVDMLELARIQELAGNIKAAIATCQRLLPNSHDKASVEIVSGMFALSHGDKSLATGHFENALANNQDAGFAHFHLAKTVAMPDQLPTVNAAIARSKEQSVANVQAPLHFAKGYLLEKTGEYEAAFQALERANELVASVKENDNEQRRQTFEQSRKTFTADFVRQLHRGKTDGSKRPVFVTGLPRSGTTLVEQIIAGHSDASGLGEVELIPLLLPTLADGRPESFLAAAKSYRGMYPAELAMQQRMVDKSISSLLHLGAIISMFPNSTIVVCQRHPLDVAWSAYKQYFNDGALAYTYSFERIAEHQKLYSQALDHWRSLFPKHILNMRYEDLVSSPEDHAKQLISHINLPWQDACLDFYKSKNPVRTASYDQVRQPIYTSSIGGWKPYEPWLGDLKKMLETEINTYEQPDTSTA